MPYRFVEIVVILCFAKCFEGMGKTNERIARIQETYVANATTNWLESLERSLAQMKEYQVRLLRVLLSVREANPIYRLQGKS